MTTERFEAPLERMQFVEIGVNEPIRRTASGGVDYDYYLARGRHLRAMTFSHMVKRVLCAIRRFHEHFRAHTRIKGNMNKRPASVGEH